jgi:hypothetical protein
MFAQGSVFDKFPIYHVKILLRDFNAKAGRVDILKSTIGNDSFHEISNDNEVVNSATTKNLTAKSTKFAHRDFNEFT